MRRFLKSAVTTDNPFQTTAEAIAWLDARRCANTFHVERIPLADVGGWSFEPGSGDLAHRSGKFFRVHGVRTRTNVGPVPQWDQPIIDQPEIGILGIIAREFDGVLHFLMQAKMEPGNVNTVQLSPTVQATRSNYTQVHQGAIPRYLEYFLEPSMAARLVDELQFEQASAFLQKRNRNMVVEAPGDLPIYDDFRWFTLGQIKELLGIPNLVSMDTRTVVACIPLVDSMPGRSEATGVEELRRGGRSEFQLALLASMQEPGRALHRDDDLIGWLSDLKCRYELDVRRIGLVELDGWTRDAYAIRHEADRYFSVVGVRVEASNREVARWDQPLVKAAARGLTAFLVKKVDGVLHLLVQAKVEPGNLDVVALAPTVQCTLGWEDLADPASWPPFTDAVLEATAEDIRYRCVQSEEGGRFYHVENEYMVVELDADWEAETPDNFRWLTLRQLGQFLRYSYVNIEARSLLACLRLA